jgi:hypothetical protein
MNKMSFQTAAGKSHAPERRSNRSQTKNALGQTWTGLLRRNSKGGGGGKKPTNPGCKSSKSKFRRQFTASKLALTRATLQNCLPCVIELSLPSPQPPYEIRRWFLRESP